MKRWFIAFLALTMLFGLVGCATTQQKATKDQISGEWKRSSYYNSHYKAQCFNTLLLLQDGTYTETVADPATGTVYGQSKGNWFWDEESQQVRLKKVTSSGTVIFDYDPVNNTLYQDAEIVYHKMGS